MHGMDNIINVNLKSATHQNACRHAVGRKDPVDGRTRVQTVGM